MGDRQGTHQKEAMSYQLIVRSTAQRDIAEIALWYDQKDMNTKGQTNNYTSASAGAPGDSRAERR